MRSKDKPLGDKNKAQNKARKAYDEAVYRAFRAYRETNEQADIAHKEALEKARKVRDEVMDEAQKAFTIACGQSGDSGSPEGENSLERVS